MNPQAQPHKTMARIAVALASLPKSDRVQNTAAVFLQAFRLASRWMLDVYRDPRSPELQEGLEELREALAQSLEVLTHALATGADVNEDVLFPHATTYLAPATPQTIEDMLRLRDLLGGEVEAAGAQVLDLTAEAEALGGVAVVKGGGE